MLHYSSTRSRVHIFGVCEKKAAILPDSGSHKSDCHPYGCRVIDVSKSGLLEKVWEKFKAPPGL